MSYYQIKHVNKEYGLRIISFADRLGIDSSITLVRLGSNLKVEKSVKEKDGMIISVTSDGQWVYAIQNDAQLVNNMFMQASKLEAESGKIPQDMVVYIVETMLARLNYQNN